MVPLRVENGGGARRVEVPQVGHDKLRLWFVMLMVVCVCTIPLMIDLGQGYSTSGAEREDLVVSQEMWLRVVGGMVGLGIVDGELMGNGDEGVDVDDGWHDWMVPRYNGRERVDRPPMVAWVNMVAWSQLEPGEYLPGDLILCARLASVVMIMLGLGAMFWVGYSVGDIRTGVLSVLVMGTGVLLICGGRVASREAHLLGWVTLSVAAGLWAMRPIKPVNWLSRQVIGWLLSGAALGGAILTDGLTAMIFMSIPLIGAIVVTGRRRLANGIGLLFAVLLGMAISVPWYLHVLERVSDGWGVLSCGGVGGGGDGNVVDWWWYCLMMVIVVWPWTVWFVGSLIQGVVVGCSKKWRHLLVGWLWFVGAYIAVELLGDGEVYSLLLVLPASGLLIGQFWSWHASRAVERQTNVVVRVLCVAHWLMLFVVSVGVGLSWLYEERLSEGVMWLFGVLGYESMTTGLGETVVIKWYMSGLCGGVLVVLTLLGTRWHYRWRPMHGAVVTALWMIVLSSVYCVSYFRVGDGVNNTMRAASAVSKEIGDCRLMFLYVESQDAAEAGMKDSEHMEPGDLFLFYIGRVVNDIVVDDLDRLAQKNIYVMARVDRGFENDKRMKDAGFERVMSFGDGRQVAGFKSDHCILYRSLGVGRGVMEREG